MDLRTKICFQLSRRLMRQPSDRSVDYDAYGDWRHAALARSWEAFSDDNIRDKHVVDFGCGDGQLSLFLAMTRQPRRIVGIDLVSPAIDRAKIAATKADVPNTVEIEYLVGQPERMPVPDQAFDTLLAFDCLEHVMSPESIIRDWFRVLRPGGRALVNWYPYKGPWGPHMESLVPIPWAHVMFGERAMLRTAEKIYDLSEFVPRHWDLDGDGNKKPNKWKAWSSFEEQAYINKLDIPNFRRIAEAAGFRIARFDARSFAGSRIRRGFGHMLMHTPVVGEYFTSYVVIELERPA